MLRVKLRSYGRTLTSEVHYYTTCTWCRSRVAGTVWQKDGRSVGTYHLRKSKKTPVSSLSETVPAMLSKQSPITHSLSCQGQNKKRNDQMSFLSCFTVNKRITYQVLSKASNTTVDSTRPFGIHRTPDTVFIMFSFCLFLFCSHRTWRWTTIASSRRPSFLSIGNTTR